MYQRVGKVAFKKDLTNIRKLCTYLGEPQTRFPTIHIAGTNGKGSSAHMIAAIFQAAGYKTGLYTSPHYRDFRERIKINGRLIYKKDVIGFVKKHKAFFLELQPSFFEITVALAFEAFANQEVDIAIIETGLGGRLDSTNIINPELSLITNISLDHQVFLGDTLPEIAGEKAGIIKVNTPVVISERQESVEKVFIEKAKILGAPLSFASDHIQADALETSFTGNIYRVRKDQEIWLDKLLVEVYGDFQANNLTGVLHCVHIMGNMGWNLTATAIRNGLKNLKSRTNYLGRWHKIANNPLTLCDSGHNEAGWQQVISHLEKLEYESLHFVLGTVNDKKPDKLVSILPKFAHYYIAKPAVPRGLDAKILTKHALGAGLKVKSYNSIREALKAAQSNAGENDLVFVGGSTFVVAEVV